MSGLSFPSDASDSSAYAEEDAEEYDEDVMTGPEVLLFKTLGWPAGPPWQSAQHAGTTRETCPVCSGRGWLYVLPSGPS